MLAEIIFALMVAVIFTLILSRNSRINSVAPLTGFFLMLFLVVWAGGLWLVPAGPVFYGIYWLPSLLLAFMFFLLIIGLAVPFPPKNAEEAIEAAQAERALEISFNVFFWTILILLIAAIISAYV